MSALSAIVAENCKAGSPSTEWDINGAGDPEIQGLHLETRDFCWFVFCRFIHKVHRHAHKTQIIDRPSQVLGRSSACKLVMRSHSRSRPCRTTIALTSTAWGALGIIINQALAYHHNRYHCHTHTCVQILRRHGSTQGGQHTPLCTTATGPCMETCFYCIGLPLYKPLICLYQYAH